MITNSARKIIVANQEKLEKGVWKDSRQAAIRIWLELRTTLSVREFDINMRGIIQYILEKEYVPPSPLENPKRNDAPSLDDLEPDIMTPDENDLPF